MVDFGALPRPPVLKCCPRTSFLQRFHPPRPYLVVVNAGARCSRAAARTPPAAIPCVWGENDRLAVRNVKMNLC